MINNRVIRLTILEILDIVPESHNDYGFPVYFVNIEEGIAVVRKCAKNRYFGEKYYLLEDVLYLSELLVINGHAKSYTIKKPITI